MDFSVVVGGRVSPALVDLVPSGAPETVCNVVEVVVVAVVGAFVVVVVEVVVVDVVDVVVTVVGFSTQISFVSVLFVQKFSGHGLQDNCLNSS